MNKPSKFVGSAEACRVLDVDRSTLTRWVKAGRLKTQARSSDHTNGALLFARRDVDALAVERAHRGDS